MFVEPSIRHCDVDKSISCLAILAKSHSDFMGTTISEKAQGACLFEWRQLVSNSMWTPFEP